jgi:hypothetical protein
MAALFLPCAISEANNRLSQWGYHHQQTPVGSVARLSTQS